MKESALLSIPPELQNKAKKSRKRKRKNAAAAADPDSQNTSSGVFKVTEGKASTSDSPVDKPADQSNVEGTEPSKKKRKRNKNKKNKKGVGESASKAPKTASGKDSVNADIRMSDDRLKAYGLVPNQYKHKVKKAKYMKK